MSEIEIPEFNVGKDGINDEIARFSNTCVNRVEIFSVSANGSNWVETQWPDWINYRVTSTNVMITINPIGDISERTCILSALTYDENDELISGGTCGYMVKVIQKQNTTPYHVPTNADMPDSPILPEYKCCIISGTTTCDNSDIIIPSSGGNVSLDTKIWKKDNSRFVHISGDTMTGDLIVQGSIYQTSDERLKENIVKANYTDMANVNMIKIKKFNFIDDENKKPVYGVIAQDVETFMLNDIVATREDGMKVVDYTGLSLLKIAYLENEVRKLDEMIERLLENN
jgi:hypothetical protein